MQPALGEGLEEARQLLRQRFGHDDFRPGQAEAVDALLSRRDVIALLPTGGGKSICYQVPALVTRQRGRGATLVVSPLIALMEDQVASLVGAGVRAAAIHSHRDLLENRAALGQFVSGKLDILYISPERSVLDGFRRMLQRAEVGLLAIDEAHCISQWGHDFRPEYMRLGELRALLEVPTIAVTATATGRVMEEIGERLELRNPVAVHGDFTRPNLAFAVFPLSSDAERIAALAATLDDAGLRSPGNGRAIVYCATRKKTEQVREALASQGFPVGYYHAGRSEKARVAAHRAYDSGRTPILVATNAFGMGIDHPDVRLLVHFQTPGSVEAYYQEAGRAGRDGRDAACHLYFGISDLVTQRFLARKQGGSAGQQRRREQLLKSMEAYATATECRQEQLASYFTGASPAPCGRCDVCVDGAGVGARIEALWQRQATNRAPAELLGGDDQQTIIAAVASLPRPVGKGLLALALRGSRAKQVRRRGLCELPQHGLLRHHSEASLVATIEHLLRDGQLARRGNKYPTVWLPGRPVRAATPQATPRKKSPTRRQFDTPLVRALDNYRRKMARSLRWKPYMVFQKQVMRALDDARPNSLWALQEIRGLGPAKIERFGSDILDIIRRYDEPPRE